MDDTPAADESAGGPKRVMGGKPAVPKIVGRPYIPGTERGEQFPGERAPADGSHPDAPPLEEEPQEGEAVAMEPVRGSPVNPETMPAETMRFEHACCRAVRPNPQETDADGNAVKETRPEPFLEWQGPIKPTSAFGVLLVLVGVGAGLSALMAFQGIGLVSLIALGATGVLVAYLVASYLILKSGLRGIDIRAHRHVLDPKIERGRLFHSRLDTTGSRFPGSLSVTVAERKAPGLRPVEHPVIPGEGQVTYKVRPQGRGLVTFAGLLVTARSFDRLWLAEQHWRLRTTVEVEASLPAVTWKALVTGYAPFDQATPSCIVKLYRDIETEVVRDYAAGDRLRDVNWKFFSRMGKMVIRQRTTEGESTILLVIDATQPMLTDQAGYRNLDMAVEIAQEFADAGLRRNHEVGFLAFNEERIVDHVRPSRAKTQIKKVIKHLQNLADHHLPEEGEDPVEILIAGDPANLRLGFGQGLKQRNTATLTMIFFTDLQSTPESIVQSASKAAQSGHRVAVMLMPPPRLRPVSPGGRSSAEQEAELRGIEHTNRMRELLIANGCEFMEVNPTEEDFKLEAVVPEEKPAAKKPGPGPARPGAPKQAVPRPKPVPTAKPAVVAKAPAKPTPRAAPKPGPK